MNTEKDKYHPIACSFYDRIQNFAIRQTQVKIVFELKSGIRQEIMDRIEDVFTRDKAEFIRTNKGIEIRLDKLISVGEDRQPSTRCGIDPDFNPCGDADEY